MAFDLGASGGWVAFGWIENGRLPMEVLHRFANTGVPLGTSLYWDALGLWREMLDGLGRAAVRGPIASVGVTTWGVDYARVTGRAPRRLHVVGGGSRIALLNALLARACTMPVIAGPVEATSIGNLLDPGAGDGRHRTRARCVR